MLWSINFLLFKLPFSKKTEKQKNKSKHYKRKTNDVNVKIEIDFWLVLENKTESISNFH